MMTTRMMLAAGAALVMAGPVAAQSTFPTRAAGVRAGGSVLMICDVNASNCAPAAPSNPMPVTAMGAGPSTSATSQSVVPANDSAPFPVVGNVASGATDSGAPVKTGCIANGSIPTAVTAGQRVNNWCDVNGGEVSTLRIIGAAPGTAQGNLGFLVDYGTAPRAIAMAPFYFDGTTQQAARGDTSGMFIGASQFWTESTAALAASATLTGTLRANGGAAGGVGSRFAFFTASAFSDVAGGTLYVDVTVDAGTTWRQVGSAALVAGSSVTLKVPVTAAGYRGRVVNGTTAQGAALVTTSYSVN